MGFTRQGVLFREVESFDLTMLRNLRNAPIMGSGWNDPVSVQTPLQQYEWYESLDRNNQAFIVQDHSGFSGPIIGLLRFRLDPANRRAALTGTDVAPDKHGQGYGKRILRAGAEHLLIDLGYHRITAEHMEGNIGADKIIKACGFHFEGIYRKYVWRDGDWRDWYFYSLLAGELK